MKGPSKRERSFLGTLAEHGVFEPELLDASTFTRVRDAWRARYGRELERRYGGPAYGGYEWHAFSFETYPCLSGDAAMTAYQAKRGAVVVITAYLHDPIVGARCEKPPMFDLTRPRRTMPPDILVFPEDLAWTFAMTHEAGLYGPYFATGEVSLA